MRRLGRTQRRKDKRRSQKWCKSARKILVYYESRKRELKIRLMNEVRCDERLKARVGEWQEMFV
jgi:hypothetical protein